MKRLLFVLFTVLTLPLFAAPELTVKLSSAHLVKGETTYLRFYVTENFLDANPVLPQIKGLEISLVESRDQVTLPEKRQRAASYVFAISALREGSFIIPSIKLTANNIPLTSPQRNITVHSRSELEEEFLQIGDDKYPYFTKLFLESDTLYPNQTQRAELKFYFPPKFGLQSPNLPETPNTTNLAAWRFETPNLRYSLGTLPFGNNPNENYEVYTFKTYCNGLQPGTASFGDITTTFRAQVVTHRSAGFVQRQTRNFPLSSGSAEFQVIPFPAGAPAGFQGAIGSFNLGAIAPSKLSIKDSESLSIRLSIVGEGNLGSVNKPIMAEGNPWDIIDISEVERGDERRSNTGTIEFDYLIQPNGRTKSIPSFSFVYFDPERNQYRVNSTQEIPVTITKNLASATAAATPKAIVPVEAMSDILGLIDPIRQSAQPSFWSKLPFWWWQPLPILILLVMLFISLRRRLREYRLKDSRKAMMKQAFKQLQRTNKGFYKAAGAFVEKWLNEKPSKATEEILSLRDQHCFSDEKEQEPNSEERQAILKSLKGLLSICLTALYLSSSSAEANPLTHWQDGEFQKALEHYQSLPKSADVEYNIANCWYRLDSPGKAALHYQRALLLDPQHAESQQNLRYLHRSLGSLVPDTPDSLARIIALLPKITYKHLLYASVWCLILSALWIFLFRPRGSRLAIAVSLLIISPILLGVSFYSHANYPDHFTNFESLSIVTEDDVEAYTEPLQHSKQDLRLVIKAPPGSLCQVLSTRADWCYVNFAQESRGWIRKQSISPITPKKENSED